MNQRLSMRQLHRSPPASAMRQSRRSLRLWWLGMTLLAAYGISISPSWLSAGAYLAVVLASMLPMWFWLRTGAAGLPILPIVGLVYLQFYAMPIVAGNYDIARYNENDILNAAAAVILFLLFATASWLVFKRKVKHLKNDGNQSQLVTDRETILFCLIGLGMGVFFEIAVIKNWLFWTGSAFGVIRAVFFSMSLLASFLMGILLGQKKLRGQQRYLAISLFTLTVLLTVSSLFLVRGIMLIATLVFANLIVTRRLMIGLLIVTIPLALLLHAGKGEMRDKYWDNGAARSTVSSVFQVPIIYGEWIADGIDAMNEDRQYQSLGERVSLLNMLLMAQTRTPSEVDFLYGETYKPLLTILIPRFIDPTKPVSQISMNMLNVRYGLVSLGANDEVRTAIGWGVIAEGFINFSYWGVIGVGLLLGAFMGLIERNAIGKSALSLQMLLAIITLLTMINLEVDLTYLVSILWQSFIVIFFIYLILRFRRRKYRMQANS